MCKLNFLFACVPSVIACCTQLYGQWSEVTLPAVQVDLEREGRGDVLQNNIGNTHLYATQIPVRKNQSPCVKNH